MYDNSKQYQTYHDKLCKLKERIFKKDIQIGHLRENSKHSRRKTYNTLDFLWLNIVLTSMKYIHIREKISYLQFLKSSNMLDSFYQLIGVPDLSRKIPSIGFFSDYVKYFDSHQLEQVINDVLHEMRDVNTPSQLMSIDGKDIRHCRAQNVKSVNVVVNNQLLSSFNVNSEMSWVKEHFLNYIDKMFKQDKKRYIFTGDGIYHHTEIRRFFAKRGYQAILPMSRLTHRFEGRLNSTVDMKAKQGFTLSYSENDKRNGMLINEKINIVKVDNNKRYKEFNQWKYVIKIESETTKLDDGQINFKTRRFITNVDVPLTMDSVKYFRQLIRKHWQVETYHQYKDMNLAEDRYSKSRKKAHYKSMLNNLAIMLHNTCGIKTKHQIEMFKNQVLMLVIFYLFF